MKRSTARKLTRLSLVLMLLVLLALTVYPNRVRATSTAAVPSRVPEGLATRSGAFA